MSFDIKYRKRAITYLQDGHTYQETTKVFGISPKVESSDIIAKIPHAAAKVFNLSIVILDVSQV